MMLRHGSTSIFALLFCVLGSAHQFEEELAEQMGLYIHAGRGTGKNEYMLWLHNIVTCTPIARQSVGKQVPAKTDSW
jgi:hypothetical protein